ncbi:zinc ABC transporter substrate-binding protein [Desulfoluna sp.]|uniref:metal ABC transporter solute-binding protein, Zn/Mn family n=1 Tax=Desulfoluna sp. TaxID=2045199 RepID=UPI002633DB84|nr:zinc ABC transporter substrate-binding protein [Desulfoluna sp.]
MRKRVISAWVGLVFLMGVTLNAGAEEVRVKAFVSIPPQQAFLERIGGDRVEVRVLLTPGESPAMYRPKPSKVARLAASDLFFRIGLPYETLLISKIKSMAGDLTVVDTRKGVALLSMGEHSHGEASEHTKGRGHGEDIGNDEGMDPHIWLDPMRVVAMAGTMRDALVAADPEGRLIYEAGSESLIRELVALHQTLSAALAPLAGETLYVFHPAFGYFADAYGLVQKAVEVEGKSPKGRALTRYIAQARAEGVRVIFVQPQFDRNAADKVAAAVGGVVVPLDPLAPHYFKNLRSMAEVVAKRLGEREH